MQRTKRLTDFFGHALATGGLNILLFFFTRLITNQFQSFSAHIPQMIEVFGGGFSSWFLAFGLVQLFERWFQRVSRFTFIELTDINHPILQELFEKAPGTYQHSIAVGNMAAMAALAIGADATLARAGGYFHDIGKLSRPEFFMENRQPADLLVDSDLNTNLEIIKAHVKHGVEIARSNNLPPAIIDFISQHHGTTTMEFFYYRSMKDDLTSHLPRNFFRYDGALPSSAETAIVMIADSVEAISRVLPPVDEGKSLEIVMDVIHTRFNEGQFDDANLTARDFTRIARALMQTLVGATHSRTAYPKMPGQIASPDLNK